MRYHYMEPLAIQIFGVTHVELTTTEQALLAQIEALGYFARIQPVDDGYRAFAATRKQFHQASAETSYAALCALAESVGIELDDG